MELYSHKKRDHRLVTSLNPQKDGERIVTRRLSHATFKSGSMTALIMSERASELRNGHCIFLYLPTRRTPLEVWNHDEFILGRSMSDDPDELIVDLTDEYAHRLGVSRKHAKIIHRNGGYFVADLNSSNGTWVNENKLSPFEEHPLQSGDTLRLGHLIIVVG